MSGLLKLIEAFSPLRVLVLGDAMLEVHPHGEPIVCAPRDAVESFWTSPLDCLVIGSFLLSKPAGA